MADMRSIKMQQWSNKYCTVCKKRMNKWDERCAYAVRTPPMCENCLADKFGKTIEELNQWLDEVYKIRRCQFQ
jgi:hypothetical protein